MLTATELGIHPEHREALIRVRDGLCSGEFIHIDIETIPRLSQQKVYGKLFNMRNWNSVSSCGTVCCIGGWVEQLTGLKFDGESTNQKADNITELHNLFFPYEIGSGSAWKKITPKQAAAAITNYLEEGKPYWKEVMK